MRMITGFADTTVPSDAELLAIEDFGLYEPIEGGITPGEAGILDVDGALAMVNLVGLQILQHPDMALLAQANLEPAQVLRLLGEGYGEEDAPWDITEADAPVSHFQPPFIPPARTRDRAVARPSRGT